jgi:hypothetical protein
VLGLGASAASRDASGRNRRAMRRWQDMGAGGVDRIARSITIGRVSGKVLKQGYP